MTLLSIILSWFVIISSGFHGDVFEYQAAMSLCEGIDSRLYDVVYSLDMSDFYITAEEFSNVRLCNQPYGHYGYALVGLYSEIFINDILLDTPNTLYNVLLHEVTHVLGGVHSDRPGIMNYSLLLNFDGSVHEDDRKLWV
jgi:hypothetical protein